MELPGHFETQAQKIKKIRHEKILKFQEMELSRPPPLHHLLKKIDKTFLFLKNY